MQYTAGSRDLPVWRKADRAGWSGFTGWVRAGASKGYSGLAGPDRTGGACSISNNIAEGFERGTRDELIAFLYIARGSAGEVRSMLSRL